MDSQVEEVKNKVDIVSLINEYVPLNKAGRNYKALCPFHNEKTPSFMVSPDRQIFKCFGCGEGGDVFAFYKKMEGLEFGDAFRALAARAGVQLKEHKVTRAEKQKETLLKINEIAATFYHYILTKHPLGKKALEYLSARGIRGRAIADFRLGFAPSRDHLLLQVLSKKGFGVQEAVNAGVVLVSGNRPRDRFRDRITFPIFDTIGKVIAFSGRALANIEPKYLNSPDTSIFNKSRSLYGVHLAKTALKKEKSAILVEGNLDVISSHQVGVNNVVAPLGTALTFPQVEILKRWTEGVLFAFDSDLAGDAAAKRAIEIAESAGLNIRVVQLKKGKDPDELIHADPLAWKKAVKESVAIYDYFIDSAIRKYGSISAEGKRKVASEVLPILSRVNDEILKAHYFQTLASKLGVDEEVLREAAVRYSGNQQLTNRVKEVLEKPLGEKGEVLVEKYLLALITQSGQVPESLNDKLFGQVAFREIANLIGDFYQKEGRLRIKTFVKRLPSALLPTFDELLLLEIHKEMLDDEEKIWREINYCVDRLKELNLRTKLKSLSLAIKQAEAAGKKQQLDSLTRQFQKFSKALVSFKEKIYVKEG